MKQDIAQETIKSSPPVAVAAAAVAGLTLNDWVMIATLVYIAIQAGYLAWKWYREYKGRK